MVSASRPSNVAAGRPTDAGAGFSRSDDVIVATEQDRQAWDAFVQRHPSATGYHAWAWRTVFERGFGHRSVYLAARREGRIEGVLPIVEMRSRLFGRMMVSLPFVNYGGIVADTEGAARALLDAAARLARASRCRHVELRHADRRFADLPCKQHKVAMHLELGPGLWEVLDRKVRNQIRKAEKSGLTVDRGGVELLRDFYTVFARNMRDLGTPVYAIRFFEEILRAFPAETRVLVVRLKGQPIAGGITFRSGHGIEVPWASSIRDFNALCPNHLLYWKVIETAIAEGCSVLDFGRSTPGEGTYKFKEQWGARPVPLHWEYQLLADAGVPDQSPKNPKFRLAIETWKHLPLWLANAAGPHIVRSIP